MPTTMVIDVLRSLASDPDCEPDGELVTRFAESRDPAAFAELVRRHGPTVFGVCRRVLGHVQDAEDAFQAVWLVLARRAVDVRPPGAVGPWLYGVAVRTATKARVLAMKRRHRQLAAAKPEAVEDAPPADLGPLLDEELARLPERYRRAVVACDLNGRSRSQAARDLGWPEGTVAARVAKGRELLAARLRQRGVTLSSAALAAVLASAARADLPPSLAANAVAAALEFASGAASASVPPVSRMLAEGVMRAMSLSRWKLPAVVLMTAGLAAGGVVVASSGGPPEKPRVPDPVRPVVVTRAAPVPTEKGPTVLKDHGDLVYSVAVHPEGKTIASGGADGRVIVHDAKTLKKLWEAKLVNPGTTAVAYSADGALIAATHKDGVTLLDAVTGKTIREFEEKGSDPHAVAFTPTTDSVQGVRLHKLVFANGRTTFVKSWAEGAEPGTVTFDPSPNFYGGAGRPGAPLAFSPDGKRVLMTRHEAVDGKIAVWAWSAGSGVPNVLLTAHTAAVYAAAWSKDGKRIATAGDDGRVILWDVKEGEKKDDLTITEARRFEMPEGSAIYSLAFSPDGKTLVAGGFQAGMRRDEKAAHSMLEVTYQVWRWDLATNKPLAALRVLPNEAVNSLVFSPDGKMLVAATGNPFIPRPPGETREDRAKRGGVHVWRLTPNE
ncbi:MAG TPA: sigma-70 family RNA polymerase sigma factor [Fimbriiglobus sp.]|nr:sigma-70 family RNA polymerase sigma factor [Fimbriiglobus sp.]